MTRDGYCCGVDTGTGGRGNICAGPYGTDDSGCGGPDERETNISTHR